MIEDIKNINSEKQGYEVKILNKEGEVIYLHKVFQTLNEAKVAAIITQAFVDEELEFKFNKISFSKKDVYVHELI